MSGLRVGFILYSVVEIKMLPKNFSRHALRYASPCVVFCHHFKQPRSLDIVAAHVLRHSPRLLAFCYSRRFGLLDACGSLAKCKLQPQGSQACSCFAPFRFAPLRFATPAARPSRAFASLQRAAVAVCVLVCRPDREVIAM